MIKIKGILFPTDFSRCAQQALTYAVYLAKQYNAKLFMLHAVVLHQDDPHNPAYYFPNIAEINKKLDRLATDEMKDALQKHHAETLRTKREQRWGVSAAPIILEYAVEKNIDLIVMGTQGRRGLGHFFLGSVAEEVVRLAPCPVLTIREQERARPLEKIKNILVPIDFSQHSQKALSYAKEIAAIYHAQLQLLHVIEETVHPAFYVTGETSIFKLIPDIKTKSEQAMQQLLQKTSGPPVHADLYVVEGRAVSEIIRFADYHAIDLIVITTHGLTGLKHDLLGSVTEKVVRQAQCPVFTVKSFGKSLL